MVLGVGRVSTSRKGQPGCSPLRGLVAIPLGRPWAEIVGFMSDMFSNASAYDSFMGRFSRPLAREFIDVLTPKPGGSILDVGCGTGALTELLIEASAGGLVEAVDPSAEFVAAARERFPGTNVGVAAAESLPFAAETFDLTVAQLVVHFMSDAVAGIREMSRVTKRGGVVAANVWDFGGSRGPLGVFESVARSLDPDAPSEALLPGTSEGDLERIFTAAGLTTIGCSELIVSVDFATFDEWWAPFTSGVGPAGRYVASLKERDRARLREEARRAVGKPPISIQATAFAATGVVGIH